MLVRLLLCLSAVFVLTSCADDEDAVPPIDELDTPEDRTDAGVDDVAPPDLGSAEGVCGWLTPDEIDDATGLKVRTASPAEGSCIWELDHGVAVVDGPNEDEEVLLRASTIEEDRFEAQRREEPGVDIERVDDVGQEAFLRRTEADFETSMFVRDDSSFFTVTLVAAFDDPHAARDALVDLSRRITEAD